LYRTKWCICVVALILTLTLILAIGGEVWAKTLQVWANVGGESLVAWNEVMEEFTADTGIEVETSGFAAHNYSTSSKLVVSVVAGSPPDAVVLYGTSTWAVAGVLETLDSYIERDGLGEDDFWPASWREVQWDGHVWAVPLTSDPNFAFVWNKDVFAENGIPVDYGPETIAEMDSYTRKLTETDIDGNLKRVGVVPWWVYGYANSLFTWGIIFGGDFYNYDTQQVTTDDRNVVRALEWMKSYADTYGFEAIQQSGANFSQGTQVMTLYHYVALRNLKVHAPEINYGMGFIPYLEGSGRRHVGWVGGWKIGIPVGVKDPDASWELISWLCASPKGSTLYTQKVRELTGYRKSPIYDELLDDPEMASYVQILANSPYHRPAIPVQSINMDEMDRAVDSVLKNEKPPLQALKEAAERVQMKLDEVLKTGRLGM